MSMKFTTLLFTTLFLSVFLLQPAYSQDSKETHSFKITGSKCVPSYAYSLSGGKLAVEYDTASTDHLYITEYNKNGLLKTKTRLLFKGEQFKLNNSDKYANTGELLVDGIQTVYREDKSVASEILYKGGKLQQQILFYPNGNKQMLISGSDKIMNGDYKIWYPNGILSFSGKYRYNLKNGEFQQFDESGALLKKGIYSGGKLISGEAVVQDKTFEIPDQPAKYAGGGKAFDDYLRMKTSELKVVKDMAMGLELSIPMKMTISKTGSIEKIDILGSSNPNDKEILNAAFGDFPGFLPATVEDVPVSSILKLNLIYTNQGLQANIGSVIFPDSVPIDSLKGPAYIAVEEMPEFPGGDTALRNFLSNTVRYPMETAEKGIQGKVFVKFVVEADGSISNVKIERGIYPILDAEAVRVIQKMPRWSPGRQKGKPVRVSFTVPVNFILQ